MNEQQVLELFHTCSNWERWGPGDDRGTLNYITPQVRLRALRSVRHGEPVSLGRDLRASRSSWHAMLYVGPDPISTADVLTVAPHGFDVTHVDALGHGLFQGRGYGGRQASETVTAGGLAHASIAAMADGVVTRGVLLDVAAASGVAYLPTDAGVGVGDLEAAQRIAGVAVQPGDAIFVHTGRDRREAAEGVAGDDAPRPGLLPESVLWLHERQIAMYSGDCIERMPSGYPRVPMPLHQIGLVAMGLAILDNPDMERLLAATDRYESSAFLLVVAPLRIGGGTASAVNPLAVF